MIKFEHTEVLGWEHAIRGMRNPLNSWDKSDSHYAVVRDNHSPVEEVQYIVGENDYCLMKRLSEAGTDHRKFMRMITVYVDITAPLYWWKEFDTYKVGTVANSCSTMHKLAAKKFTIDDFSHEHLMELADYSLIAGTADPLARPVDYQLPLNYTIKALNTAREMYLQTKDKKYWYIMVQLLPSSYNQKRTVMLNYEVLANICKPSSRLYHKLCEWNIDYANSFCEWATHLPHSELIFGEHSED